IAANCPRNTFITLFAGQLDPVTGELAYCNAGHNAPLLLHADDEVEHLDATGVPLGILREASYEVKRCRLEPDDVMVLFSDGITEACAPENFEEFGEQRLIDTIWERRSHSAASLIEAMNAKLLSFTGGIATADDITLVLIRRLAAT
ncbi:MAG: PP2C family protein-serine/threonine phosphatase, partial [Bryobacteraceae bacterium]